MARPGDQLTTADGSTTTTTAAAGRLPEPPDTDRPGTVGHWTTPDSGHRTLDTGHRAVDSGQWTPDIGQWTSDSGHRTLDTGHWTLDTGHWTLDTGHRTPDRDSGYDRIELRRLSLCQERKSDCPFRHIVHSRIDFFPVLGMFTTLQVKHCLLCLKIYSSNVVVCAFYFQRLYLQDPKTNVFVGTERESSA